MLQVFDTITVVCQCAGAYIIHTAHDTHNTVTAKSDFCYVRRLFDYSIDTYMYNITSCKLTDF